MKLQTTYHSNNYPIIIEHGAIAQLPEYVSDYDKVFLLVDAEVDHLFSTKYENLLTDQRINKLLLPSGEQTKTFSTYQQIIEQLLSYQVTRNTAIVAIGGGAVGDFAGFIAATLLRGVAFIQVPTTILAHDSSIGGKVGINSEHGKNLIGAFYRPQAVIYDLDFLETLPYEEILSGYAEVYKHALLNGTQATSMIEQHFEDKQSLMMLQGMDTFIAQGIETKLNIVVADEKEQGVRKYLNLGHTFGHAVEYQHKIAHGHAVMIGILYQFIVANELLQADHDIQHYIDYVMNLGYPLAIIKTLDFETLYQYMLSDKKNNSQGIQMVLLQHLGEVVVQHVDKATLQSAFNQLQSYIK